MTLKSVAATTSVALNNVAALEENFIFILFSFNQVTGAPDTQRCQAYRMAVFRSSSRVRRTGRVTSQSEAFSLLFSSSLPPTAECLRSGVTGEGRTPAEL